MLGKKSRIRLFFNNCSGFLTQIEAAAMFTSFLGHKYYMNGILTTKKNLSNCNNY